MIKANKSMKLSFSLSISCLALALSSAVNANVTDKDITDDQMTTDDVVSYGLGLKGQRYSPLTKINADTVEEMRPAWAFSLGVKNSVDKSLNH